MFCPRHGLVSRYHTCNATDRLVQHYRQNPVTLQWSCAFCGADLKSCNVECKCRKEARDG